MYMKFWIQVEHAGQYYRYLVEHKPVDARTEHFVVKSRNQTFTFTSNRPSYKSDPGLEKREPIIELIEGEVWSISFIEKIAGAIAAWFDKIPVVYTPAEAK